MILTKNEEQKLIKKKCGKITIDGKTYLIWEEENYNKMLDRIEEKFPPYKQS